MPHKRIAKQQHPVLPFVGCCLSLFLLLLLLNPFLRVFHVLALGLAVPIHRCRSPLLLSSASFHRIQAFQHYVQCLRHRLQSFLSLFQTRLQAVHSRALLARGTLLSHEAASLSAHPTLLTHKKIAFLRGHLCFYLPIDSDRNTHLNYPLTLSCILARSMPDPIIAHCAPQDLSRTLSQYTEI